MHPDMQLVVDVVVTLLLAQTPLELFATPGVSVSIGSSVVFDDELRAASFQ